MEYVGDLFGRGGVGDWFATGCARDRGRDVVACERGSTAGGGGRRDGCGGSGDIACRYFFGYGTRFYLSAAYFWVGRFGSIGGRIGDEPFRTVLARHNPNKIQQRLIPQAPPKHRQ